MPCRHLPIAAAVIATVTASSCSDPKLVFRGYSDRSSCEDVINAELANGAEFEGAFDSDQIERPGQIAELSGELFSEPVRIDVHCTRAGLVNDVRYVSPEWEPTATGPIFRAWAAELEAVLGPASERLTENMRGLYFLCDEPSPIALEEWKLSELEGEEENEVYLTVVPWDVECLDAQG